MPTLKTLLLLALGVACACRLLVGADEKHAAVHFQGTLLSVQMLDARTGWGTGKTERAAVLLRTGDGGGNWTDISPRLLQSKQRVLTSEADEALTFRLLDEKHGWAACTRNVEDEASADMELFSTEDGGQHWQKNAFKSSVGGIATIDFVDPKHGFIRVESDAASGQSYKAIYRTTDGGRTWQTVSEMSRDRETKGALPHVGFTDGMVFRNAEDGWVSGSPRGSQTEFFYRTTDAGKTWQPQRFPWPEGVEEGLAEYTIPRFFGPDKKEGVMSVQFKHHAPEQHALVFYGTSDGGEHWRRTGAPSVEVDNGIEPTIAFADADHGWLLAGKQLLATQDRGVTWSKVEANLPLDKEMASWEIQFVSPVQGWVLVEDYGDDAPSHLLQTTDGGHLWKPCFGPKAGDPAR